MDTWDPRTRSWQLALLGHGVQVTKLAVDGQSTTHFSVDLDLKLVRWLGTDLPAIPEEVRALVKIPDPSPAKSFWRTAGAVPIYVALIGVLPAAYTWWSETQSFKATLEQRDADIEKAKSAAGDCRVSLNGLRDLKAMEEGW
jgi:hypothetical protein